MFVGFQVFLCCFAAALSRFRASVDSFEHQKSPFFFFFFRCRVRPYAVVCGLRAILKRKKKEQRERSLYELL